MAGDTVDQRVGQTLRYRAAAPGVVLLSRAGAALHTCCVLEEALRGVRAAREYHVFDALPQSGFDLLVDTELARIDDAHRHARLDGVVQERGVHGFPHRVVAAERERKIRYPARDTHPGQVGADPFHRFDEIQAVARVFLQPGGDRKNVRIENDVVRCEAGLLRQQVVGALAHRDAPLERVGLTLLVEGHDDHRGAVLAHQARLAQEFRLAFLHADGIDDALALQALQARLDHAPFRGIHHYRHARDVGFGGSQAQESHHRLLRVEHPLVHVDVDDLRAVLDLLARHRQRLGVIARQDQAREGLRAGNVGALADVDEERACADVERLQAREAQHRGSLGGRPRAHAAYCLGDGVDVLRRGATAAACEIQESRARPGTHLLGHRFRRVVVFAESVRQAGVRVTGDRHFGDAGEFLDVLAQFLRAEGAVESHRQRTGVAHGVVERLGGLARQRAPGGVGDGSGDDQRQARAAPVELGLDREQRRLGVQRVENGFDQQQVRAAVDQPAQRVAVGGHQRFEADVAEAGVVDVRRNRRRLGSGADGAGDEARPRAVALLEFVSRFARQARGRQIELVGQCFHAVVAQRHGGRIEGIGLDDVDAGGEIIQVQAADQGRLRQRQQVVVAAQVAAPAAKTLAAELLLGKALALDHGAHGAVEDQDPLFEQRLQQGSAIGHQVPENKNARSACAETGVLPRLFSGIFFPGDFPVGARKLNFKSAQKSFYHQCVRDQ